MLHLSPLIIVLCVLFLFGCATHEVPSNKTDFRGVELGSAPGHDMVPSGLDLFEHFPDILIRSYVNPSEELSFGEIPIDGIMYEYFEQKLYKIFIEVGEDQACQKAQNLNKAFAISYEKNFKVKYFPDTGGFYWSSGQTKPKIEISCDTSLLTGKRTTMVFITEPALKAAADQYQAEIRRQKSELEARKLSESF